MPIELVWVGGVLIAAFGTLAFGLFGKQEQRVRPNSTVKPSETRR
jgi:hypothetical protein